MKVQFLDVRLLIVGLPMLCILEVDVFDRSEMSEHVLTQIVVEIGSLDKDMRHSSRW